MAKKLRLDNTKYKSPVTPPLDNGASWLQDGIYYDAHGEAVQEMIDDSPAMQEKLRQKELDQEIQDAQEKVRQEILQRRANSPGGNGASQAQGDLDASKARQEQAIQQKGTPSPSNAAGTPPGSSEGTGSAQPQNGDTSIETPPKAGNTPASRPGPVKVDNLKDLDLGAWAKGTANYYWPQIKRALKELHSREVETKDDAIDFIVEDLRLAKASEVPARKD